MLIVELYTRANCPRCEAAKETLRSKNIPFREIMVGRDIDREAVLEKYPSAKMVPIVVMNEKVIPVEYLQLLVEA